MTKQVKHLSLSNLGNTPPQDFRHLRRSVTGGFTAATAETFSGSVPRSPTTINQALHGQLGIVRARMRHHMRNDPFVRRYVELMKMNVVGPKGMRVNPVPTNDNGEIDVADQKLLRKEFEKWGRSRTCEVTHRMTWVQVQNMVITNIATDGEAFVRRIRGKAAGNDYNFGVQVIDPEQVDMHLFKTLKDKNQIIFGVEVNEFLRPIAFHVKRANADARSVFTAHMPASDHERIPVSEIYHVFNPEDATQLRGFPTAAAALHAVHQASGFMDAESIAARISASTMGFYKNTREDGSTPPAPGGVTKDEKGDFIEEIEPGLLQLLPEGWDLQFFDPKHPNSNAKDFVRGAMRMASAGLGPAYESIAQDRENVNFSSIRDGRVEERDLYQVMQEFHGGGWMTWVYQNWIEAFLLTPVGRRLPERKMEKFKKVTFIGRRWQWVDPLKQVQAQNAELLVGTKSRTEIIEESGRDPEHTKQQLEKEVDWPVPQGTEGNQTDKESDDPPKAEEDELKPGDDDDK